MALTGGDVARHNDAESCWVIIHGKAYDVTDFLPEHPGGSKVILKYAVRDLALLTGCLVCSMMATVPLLTINNAFMQGKDATEEFEPVHPPDTLDRYLDKSKHLGPVDMGTVSKEKTHDPQDDARLERLEQKPHLSQCYNLFDFEAVARRVMKTTAWGYYSSAADDEIARSFPALL
ncbi:Cytochrome b5 [Metarhizium album ARSEF 1941]|uniref:Cytochrome b5 n=1 Tax=Metarhizium album (strain ARSEF 1941) TaxID=1081103 RepID=A0A0B2WYI0_METAS|nr:Cytochrome b5 [Metarhizium album ARSEF 1941]KHN97905.1 Cytochrome b5 [Metarhizium album ARSEF 1941]